MDNTKYVSDKKSKILFILGSIIDMWKIKTFNRFGTFFSGEIINSDKIQFYQGLDIITNKIAVSDRRNIPHHLLGVIEDPDADLTIEEFCHLIEESIVKVIEQGRLPIIVGGSNNYIEALVENPIRDVRLRFDCCFIWINVSLPILYKYIEKRVDLMVEEGMVEEVREIFVSHVDYSRGIRCAIGVPELDRYFKAEKCDDELYKEDLLKSAIKELKGNTCKLALCQLGKIHLLRDVRDWVIHQIDATTVFERSGEEAANEWMNAVLKSSFAIVDDFLNEKHEKKI